MKLCTLSILAASTLLSACGGGGGGVATSPKITPVVASGPPPAGIGDVVGIVMPFRAARLESDAGVGSTSRVEYSIEFTSASDVVLNTPDGAVAMTDTGGGNFEGTLGGKSYAFQSTGAGSAYSDMWTLMEGDGIAFQAATVGYFGFEAPQSRMDELNSIAALAVYTGDSFITFVDGGVANTDSGVANLVVDFGAGTVTGQVYQTANIDMNIVGGTINANGIDGTIALAGPDSVGYSLDSSDVDGQFYGLDATELNGTFAGQGTGPSGDVEFAGGFAAN